MLIAIISDLHSNLEATQAVFDKLDEIKPSRVICLGDVAGYNANPNEVIDMVRERMIPTLMGNHDAVACGLEDPSFFNLKARRAVEWQADQLRDDNRLWLAQLPEQLKLQNYCLAVHGSPMNRDEYIVDWLDAMRQMEYMNGCSLCFFGHSHVASMFPEHGTEPVKLTGRNHLIRSGNRYLLNPGSVGQPRDRDPRAAFGLLDTDKSTFEFCRVEYDVETAARKVLDAGLPNALAERLERGK